MTSSDDVRRKQNARRPKPQTACTICKSKKLKCDRTLPCTNCRKRSPGSCVYVSKSRNARGPTTQSESESIDVDNSIKQPRQLSVSAGQLLEQSLGEIDRGPNNINDSHGLFSWNDIHDGERPSPNPVPKLENYDSEMRIIADTGWESVLSDINGINFQKNFKQDQEGNYTSANGTHSQPSLLFENAKTTSIEQLLNSLPSKSITDQLVNLFTLGLDVPVHCMHLPTFLEDYRTFWEDPYSVTLPWLSILYSVITLALQFILRSGSKIDGILFMESACKQFASKAADCLRSSDYAKPTSMTVEATLMYLLSEHMWLGEHPFRGSLILGFAIRLAMRSGYHRDPSHYRQISVFQGEIRRRVWSWLAQVDVLLASYLGLPRHINERHTDTALPTEIADEEIYPEMKQLPKCRPSDKPSAAGFLNCRAQLTKLLAQVTDYATSFHELSYEKVSELNRALDEQARQLPDWLCRLTASNERIDEIMRVNQALEIHTLVQRSYIVLHRRFFAQAGTNAKYASSYEKCVGAAMQLLRYQRLMSEIQFKVDNMTVKNWRALSLMSPNFLLGAMIICFDVDQGLRDGSTYRAEWFNERMALLRSCQRVLAGETNSSPGTQKAVHAIETVVSNVAAAKFTFSDGRGTENLVANGPFEASLGHNTPDITNMLDGTSTAPFDLNYENRNLVHNPEALQNMFEGFSTDVDWDSWFFSDAVFPV